MRGRKKPIEQTPADQLPACLPLLGDLVDALTRLIDQAVSREIARGTAPDQIAGYLRDRQPTNMQLLAHEIYAGIMDWLECPFVPDKRLPPQADDVPPQAETGEGPSCLIV